MKDEQIKALIADEKVRAAFAEAIAMCAKAVNAFAKEVGPILERLQLSPLEKEEAKPEKPKGIPINLNDTVKVKLTPFGLQHYRNFHFSIVGKWPSDPSVDASGYSNFQLHDLANIFGELLTVGNPELPFGTDMILVRDFTIAIPGPVKSNLQSRRFVFVCLVPDSIAEYYAYDFETGKCCQLKESCIRAQRTVGFMNRGLPKLSTFDWQVKDEVTKLATGQPS